MAERTQRLLTALTGRLMRLGVSVLAGLLLCVSFPPTGWWWAAVPAIALLSWVLTHPSTTPAGGFGYGFLTGLAFYLPLLPWISGLVGVAPWIALSMLQALSHFIHARMSSFLFENVISCNRANVQQNSSEAKVQCSVCNRRKNNKIH
jgi:apolipoprotein N-acyltransferase